MDLKFEDEIISHITISHDEKFLDSHDVPPSAPISLCNQFGCMHVCIYLKALVECLKPRCVYSHTEPSAAVLLAVKRIRESKVYACGGSLFPEVSPCFETVVVREALVCKSPIETQYYKSSLVRYAIIVAWELKHLLMTVTLENFDSAIHRTWLKDQEKIENVST